MKIEIPDSVAENAMRLHELTEIPVLDLILNHTPTDVEKALDSIAEPSEMLQHLLDTYPPTNFQEAERIASKVAKQVKSTVLGASVVVEPNEEYPECYRLRLTDEPWNADEFAHVVTA